MVTASPSQIYHAMRRGNVLPVTSRCNLKCVFCSHHQNPPEVKAYRLPERKSREIIESFTYLSPYKKIVVGESATGIVEGEPFCYPGIKEVLKELRRRFSETEIQITTNGVFLEPNILSFLKSLEPLELVISINTLDRRREFLGDFSGSDVCGILKEIRDSGLKFHGSVVALPHLLGWDNLAKTIQALEDKGAMTIRVFLPGFTRLAPPSLVFEPSLWEKLHQFVSEIKETISTPIILDPPLLSDFKAQVEGVIRNSPAHRAGMKKGDEIQEVQGKEVSCRVEAFNITKNLENPTLTIKRNEEHLSVTLDKRAGEPPGFVIYSDVDPHQMDDLLSRLKGLKGQQALILCSELGYPLIKKFVKENRQGKNRVMVKAVPNHFFGGSIMSAGLLVVADFIRVIENIETKPQVIILPQKPFDREGKDLLGESFLTISEKTGYPAIMI